MAKKQQRWVPSLREGAATATGGVRLTFGLFGVILVGLFLMLVAGACADVGVDYALGADDLFEKISGPLVCLACVVVAAALSATALSVVTTFIAMGYRAVLATHRAIARQRLAGSFALTGIGTLVGALGIGGWRLAAGYAAGEPGWVMQGTVVAAVGGLVGLVLLPAAIALALTRRRTRRGAAEEEAPGESFGDGGAEWTFTFLAVLGVALSLGVVEYVALARQLDGRGPLPMGDFVDLAGHPAELILPPNLEGRHAIVLVGSSCGHAIVDDEGESIAVQHVPKKVDADGDTESFARLVFRAQASRRYRVRLGKVDEGAACAADDFACLTERGSEERQRREGCPYSVRLVREP